MTRRWPRSRPIGGVAGLDVAGAANGAFTLDEALREGHRAGGGEGAAPNAPAGQYRIEAAWPKADDEGRRWIDFQNDVTLKDVALAAREGYVSVEHLKRYTTLGMATDQGKTANVNGLAAMAALTGRTIDETGTTTYRPPFVPVPMGVIAGRRRGALINPLRRLPLEAEHRAEGAQMREYGGWLQAGLVRAGRSRAFDPARGDAGARHGRAVRRLLARQDRGHRPRRRRARRLPQL